MNNQKLIAGVAVVIALVGGYFLITSGEAEEPSNIKESNADFMKNTDSEGPMDSEEVGTIVDIASDNEEFSTLVAAVTEAGLVETLSSEGPFTVFAPTNAAFEKLPDGTLESVLADKEKLTDILTYHVVEGEVTSEQVAGMNSATTVQGQAVMIKVENGNVYINDAMVVTADIQAENGVIHVIDTVLLPK